jgi:hypothetical protein
MEISATITNSLLVFMFLIGVIGTNFRILVSTLPFLLLSVGVIVRKKGTS